MKDYGEPEFRNPDFAKFIVEANITGDLSKDEVIMLCWKAWRTSQDLYSSYPRPSPTVFQEIGDDIDGHY